MSMPPLVLRQVLTCPTCNETQQLLYKYSSTSVQSGIVDSRLMQPMS